jgi:transposase
MPVDLLGLDRRTAWPSRQRLPIWCQMRCHVAGRDATRRVSWSMPFSKRRAATGRGACRRSTSLLRRRRTTTCAAGRPRGCGGASTTPCGWPIGRAAGVGPALQRRSPTASRRAPSIQRGSRGYDGGTKIKGRKRHVLTNIDGRLLAVRIQPAKLHDRDGAKPLPRASRPLWWSVRTAFTDGGYAGKLVDWAQQKTRLAPTIVKRPRAPPCFEPLPRRWVIERSFAWLIENRRLVRDFEQQTDVPDTLVTIAATATMLSHVA